ncbi:transcriptional regulator [[Actinomadura] parvosata subsp. kistnae]|nr:transcriptional regulator [Actinomadura parvosata subsp. kistnae]
MDLARAHAQRRQVDEAVARLLEAENIAAEQIRNHRVVRQLVFDLLTMQEPASPDLRELTESVGSKQDYAI